MCVTNTNKNTVHILRSLSLEKYVEFTFRIALAVYIHRLKFQFKAFKLVSSNIFTFKQNKITLNCSRRKAEGVIKHVGIALSWASNAFNLF